MIFFVQVSTTDVSGGVEDMKRAVNEGAAATYLDPIAATTPLVLLLLLCGAVNERARVLSWASVARRSRDFIVGRWCKKVRSVWKSAHCVKRTFRDERCLGTRQGSVTRKVGVIADRIKDVKDIY